MTRDPDDISHPLQPDPEAPDGDSAAGPDAPFDEVDAAVLADLNRLWSRLDPPPAGLTERLTWRLALRNLSNEVAQLERRGASDLVAGTRSTASTTSPVEGDVLGWHRFGSTARDVVIRVSAGRDGRRHLDAWITPPGVTRAVRLHLDELTLDQEVDAFGRLEVTDLPPGPCRITLASSSEAATTPPFTL